MSTIERLNQLSACRVMLYDLEDKKQELIDGILTTEIRQKIADIEAEFEPEFKSLTDKLAEIEMIIKQEVVELGETVKGDYLMAVYNEGKTSWDTEGLNGVLVVMPELAKFRKMGSPFVSIRAR